MDYRNLRNLKEYSKLCVMNSLREQILPSYKAHNHLCSILCIVDYIVIRFSFWNSYNYCLLGYVREKCSCVDYRDSKSMG